MPVDFEIPDDYGSVERTYGKFDYQEGVAGSILIAPDWVKRNIVEVRDMPGYVGHFFECHRLLAKPIREALGRAIARRPDYPIVSMAGFVPRHKFHDRAKPLSMHCWCALDINPASNAYRTEGDMPREFVEEFEAEGFLWGGHFKKKPDPMHFQLAYRV